MNALDPSKWDKAVAENDARCAAEIIDELADTATIWCACIGPLDGTGALCACAYRRAVMTAVVRIHLVRQITHEALRKAKP